MDKIQEILKNNNLEHCDVIPIGHHQLNRNYVYWIKGNQQYILKVYQQEVKFLCEKKGLELLKSNPMIPKIVDWGEKESYWILMKKIEGEILENLWTSLSLDAQKNMVKNIGELLGQIHDIKRDAYFGGWDDMSHRPTFKDFIAYRKRNDQRIMAKINDQCLPDQKLFKKAFESLKESYKSLDSNFLSSITHRDFSYRNMIVQKMDNEVIFKGLIDFEHCQMDDPCIDFNTLYQYEMLNDEMLEEIFFKSYKKYMNLPEDFENRKKYYMINLGLHTCSWSYSTAKDFYNNGIELLNKLL